MKTIKQNLLDFAFIFACVCGAGAPVYASPEAADTTGGCTAVASFSMSTSGKTITITNSSFGLSNASHYWSFGDGNWSSQQNPVHTYANNGTYTVCLTYMDNTDSTCFDTQCKQVTVSSGSACVAGYTYAQDSLGCTSSLCVNFSNLSTPSGGSMSWSFGDGSYSTQKNPTHCYTQPGNYYVCLVVADSSCTDSVCGYVCVQNLTSIGEKAAASFGLESYPNPFSSSTTISFTLSERMDVRLSVSDVLGREVALLENGSLQEGRHEVVFDGNAIAAGTYLVRLSTGQGSITKRIVLSGAPQ